MQDKEGEKYTKMIKLIIEEEFDLQLFCIAKECNLKIGYVRLPPKKKERYY